MMSCLKAPIFLVGAVIWVLILLLASRAIVEIFVDLDFESDEAKEGDLDSAPKPKQEDYVQSYACEVLTLGLFLMEYYDSVHKGGGRRLLTVWHYLFLLFKAEGRNNYAIEAFTLLRQYHFFFSPRMAQQLLWSRCINVHGRPGKKIPMDLSTQRMQSSHCWYWCKHKWFCYTEGRKVYWWIYEKLPIIMMTWIVYIPSESGHRSWQNG